MAGKLTPTMAQRATPAAQDSTMTAQHKLPVSGAGPTTLTRRAEPTALTGPAMLENGRTPMAAPGSPTLRGAGPDDCNPC